MRLQSIRLFNFQSFGPEVKELTMAEMTYLIGPNGSGKTAVLQALCRMFAFDPSLRRIRRSDFHIPYNEEKSPEERRLWIETDFVLPELNKEKNTPTIPPLFHHMQMDTADSLPLVRYRLEASMGTNGDIDESLFYVLGIRSDGTPFTKERVRRGERNQIQVHYLPARRDPAEHITYSTNTLLGRLLRAVIWEEEQEVIKGLTNQISDSLDGNPSITKLSESLRSTWNTLHKGRFFTDPKITFTTSEIEALLRHLSISFSPGHGEKFVDYSRLSDGQKSMLYLSLALASQSVGRAVLAHQNNAFDINKLVPPVFTIIALEEPENSLSPHYLGRIVSALSEMTRHEDAQALIATHAPSMLRRVPPENIRYLRLTKNRTTTSANIRLPEKSDDAHKFVREAVQAYPEIYFARLVILGEGDSEEIILPRILHAKGIPTDEYGITIAPLGGRHVNHFWRLLSHLEIPYLTLLDLDVSRHQGGWGRIKYINDQLKTFRPEEALPSSYKIYDWNDQEHKILKNTNYLEELEKRGIFFSQPMDIDFSMLKSFQEQYDAKSSTTDNNTIMSVLGKNHFDELQYDDQERALFKSYYKIFKLGSKPASHIEALSKLDEELLVLLMPESLFRLANAAIDKLNEIPE